LRATVFSNAIIILLLGATVLSCVCIIIIVAELFVWVVVFLIAELLPPLVEFVGILVLIVLVLFTIYDWIVDVIFFNEVPPEEN